MLTADVVVPQRLTHLPRDRRGFIVPAEAPWDGDVPNIAMTDSSRQAGLALTRACSMCGFPIVLGEAVARVFSQGESAARRLGFREATIEKEAPGHLTCMLYAAQVCPFLSHSEARLGANSQTFPGKRRGATASVMVYADYVAAFPFGGGEIRYMYFTLTDDIRYKTREDLSDRYEVALNERVEITAQRSYWTGSDEDMGDLEDQLRTVVQIVADREMNGEYQPALVADRPMATYTLPLL